MAGIVDNINQTTQVVFGLTGAVGQLGATVEAVGVHVGATLSAIDQRVAQSMSEFQRMRALMQGGGAAVQETQLGLVEQLFERLKGAEESPGENVGLSLIFENELKRIGAGEESIGEGIAEIRRLLSSYYEMIQRTYSIDTNPDLRQLGLLLQLFIQGGTGALSGHGFGAGAGAGQPALLPSAPLEVIGQPPTVGPRVAPPPAAPTTPRETTAGIAPAIVTAVGDRITGLGVTITRHGEQQTERVLAGVGRQTAEIRRAVSTVQEEQVRANRELAEKFREVGRTTVRIDEGVRALGQNSLQELNNALERLTLSGRLGMA